MDDTEARTLLTTGVQERDAAANAADNARRQLYDIVRRVAPHLKQVEIVKTTGWTREYVRQIVAGEK